VEVADGIHRLTQASSTSTWWDGGKPRRGRGRARQPELFVRAVALLDLSPTT
jgi:hypothetical protein